MPSPPSQVRVLESSQVSPPPGTVPESTLPLTFLDVLWLHANPNERVFFYRYPNSTTHFIEHDLPGLKSSLSLALQQFYPLAGKVRRAPESDDRHEIVYRDGDSVPFTFAECHEDFDAVSGSHARGVRTIAPLLARLPRSDGGPQPLLALQATVFPNSGVAVGVTMHHAACDGAGTISFFSWWASCCRSGGSRAVDAVAAPPLLDRSTIPDPPGLYSSNYNLLLKRSQSIEAPTPSPHDKVIACFTLVADHVNRLKEFVMSTTSQEDADSFHCSTLVVTLAYAWFCLVKTRSYPGDMAVRLCLSANCRGDLQPPLSPEYFGNCLFPIIVRAVAGDLVDGDGFLVAAKSVGKAIKAYKDGGVPAAFEGYKETLAEGLLGGGNLMVSASPKFGVYSAMDFGWGRPKQAEIVSVARTGALAVSESRDGAGGVELGIALPEHEMDAFAAHFSGGLEVLLQ